MGASLPAASGVAKLSVVNQRAGVTMVNRQVVLASRPARTARAENFAMSDAPAVPPAEGSILVRNEYIRGEPAMHGRIANH